MERIEKVLANHTVYSRKEVKDFLHQGKISVNGKIVQKSGEKIDPEKDEIFLNQQKIITKEKIYLCLNKPKGYVSATRDEKEKTVLDLVPEKYYHKDLFPAGRLDKDTTGLMILTNDGDFAHNILSPNKHVKKTYQATIDIPLTQEMQEGFKNGVELNDGICKSAELKKVSTYEAIVILKEGRYHQIKRMFAHYNATVLELKRIGMGNFSLPNNLEEGNIIELTDKELKQIEERGNE